MNIPNWIWGIFGFLFLLAIVSFIVSAKLKAKQDREHKEQMKKMDDDAAHFLSNMKIKAHKRRQKNKRDLPL